MIFWVGNPDWWLDAAVGERGSTHQHPPAFSLRSNIRILANSCSCAKASTAMAPAGPAPMIAIDFIGGISKEGIFIDEGETGEIRSHGGLGKFTPAQRSEIRSSTFILKAWTCWIHSKYL